MFIRDQHRNVHRKSEIKSVMEERRRAFRSCSGGWHESEKSKTWKPTAYFRNDLLREAAAIQRRLEHHAEVAFREEAVDRKLRELCYGWI